MEQILKEAVVQWGCKSESLIWKSWVGSLVHCALIRVLGDLVYTMEGSVLAHWLQSTTEKQI